MKRLVLLLALLSGGPVYGSSFLSPVESKLIRPESTDAGVALMDYEKFVYNSEFPATVIAHGVSENVPFIVIKRKGQVGVLYSSKAKEAYCTSSCWDDAFGKSLSGALEGSLKGGTAGGVLGGGVGWWVAGPPGATAGALLGGAGGVVIGGGLGGIAGGIEGFNTCQEKLATSCEETGEKPKTGGE